MPNDIFAASTLWISQNIVIIIMTLMMLLMMVMTTKVMESTCISGSDCPPKMDPESKKETSCHWANHLVV